MRFYNRYQKRLLVLLTIVAQQHASAFTAHAPPTLSVGTPHKLGKRRQSPTCKATTARAQQNDLTRQPLTEEEEQDLLLKAVEYRRIKEIQQELVLKSPNLSSPSLSKWAEEAGYTSFLNKGEILLENFELALEEGMKARERLVTRNMGLVHYVVNTVMSSRRRNQLKSLSRDDLVQEGCIGLARAVEKFQPSFNTKFGTYATYWIRAAVLRCIAERDDMVRIPENVASAIRKTRKAAQKLGIDLEIFEKGLNSISSSIAWKEAEAAKALALEAGLTQKQLTEVLRVNQQQKNGYAEFEPWMATKMSKSAGDAGALNDNDEKEALLNTFQPFLKPKEMQALALRYGLISHTSYRSTSKQFRDYQKEAEEELFGNGGILTSEKPTVVQSGRWGEAMSFQEIGKLMAVSSEYSRRLCSAALDKLKRAADDGELELQPLL